MFTLVEAKSGDGIDSASMKETQIKNLQKKLQVPQLLELKFIPLCQWT